MKKIALIIGALVVFATGPIMAQDQLEPLSSQEFKQITQSVQRCFSEAGTEAVAQSCLDIPSKMLELRLDCGEVTSQFHMTICAGENAKALDDILNAEYQISIGYMKYLDQSEYTTEVWDPITEANIVFSYEETLRSAQRAWLAYRESDCLARIGPNTGYSAYSMEFSECLQGFLAERIMNIILIRMGGYSMGEYDPDNFMYDDFR